MTVQVAAAIILGMAALVFGIVGWLGIWHHEGLLLGIGIGGGVACGGGGLWVLRDG